MVLHTDALPRSPLSARAGGREGDYGPWCYTRTPLCAAGVPVDHFSPWCLRLTGEGVAYQLDRLASNIATASLDE